MLMSEILVQAKRVLQRDGWTKDVLHGGGGHCALGGLDEVLGRPLARLEWERTEDYNTYVRASRYLETACPSLSVFPVGAYNDREGTTFEDILKLYDDAIAMAQADEAHDLITELEDFLGEATHEPGGSPLPVQDLSVAKG